MNQSEHAGFEYLIVLIIFACKLNLNQKRMKNKQLKTGYVMVSRSLLLDMFAKHGEADSEEEAFLRVLVYVNYKNTDVSLRSGQRLTCRRGESVIAFSRWEKILGWSHGRVHRFFRECFCNGDIERVNDDCSSHICIPRYDLWTGRSEKNLFGKESTVTPQTSCPKTLSDELPVKASATPPPPPSGSSPSAPSSACLPEPIDLSRFMDHYSEVTQTPLLNIGRAQRYWNQLTTDERQLAYDQVEDYYQNLPDIHYCMQAATYLRDKAYLNRYDY